MNLKKNIPGRNLARIEIANLSSSNLKISNMPNNSVANLRSFATIDGIIKLAKNKLLLELDDNYHGDSVYGNSISGYEFASIITPHGKVVIKISKTLTNFFTTRVECIVLDGDISWVEPGLLINWGFTIQNSSTTNNFNIPGNIEITNIEKNSAVVNWIDTSIEKNMLSAQIKYKKSKDFQWTYTSIGNSIEKFTVLEQSTNYATPKFSYNGIPGYWVEFSTPELPTGVKGTGWLGILQGGIVGFTFINRGSGYISDPKFLLYTRNPNDSSFFSPTYNRPAFTNFVRIYKINHNFLVDDIIDINVSDEKLSGTYTITNTSTDYFDIIPGNIDMFNNSISQSSGVIKLSPIRLPSRPGRFSVSIFKNKFQLQNLEEKTEYEIAIMGYYSIDLKEFSEYSTEIKFLTN